MIISLLVAMDEKGGIGKDNGLPWHLSADLKRFKALTMGHHLIMGRKTYESIGRSLPGRVMVIITRNPEYQVEGCLIAHSLEEALRIVEQREESEAFIIGGGQIFAQALPLADRIYLTRVHTVSQADVFFPPFDPQEWSIQAKSELPADHKNQFSSTYLLLSKGSAPHLSLFRENDTLTGKRK
jgi:dihydrofolate reductase